jgi:chemotaxis methyl-accepting protein methylase/uncharacterized protein with PIN domain
LAGARGGRRFLADRMLSRLARWLRVAGEDVTAPALAGSHAPARAELARRAQAEGRIVLTRDRTFPLPRADRLLIVATDLDQQLREFYHAFPADPLARAFTRCSLCNGLAAAAARDDVFADLPPAVREMGRDFRRCRDCGQVYWDGSHTARIRARLGALGVLGGVAPGRRRSSELAPDDHRGWARFDDFLRELLARLDLAWAGYRRPRRSLRPGLVARMAELGLRDYGEYLDHVAAHPEESARLAVLLAVTISRFFRDREDWATLGELVIDELAARGRREGRAVCAASLGSASGEEPYTLRILWTELAPDVPLDLLAADVRADVLARARAAVYTAPSIHSVPVDLLARHFAPEPGNAGSVYRLDRRIADRVRFVQLDFTRDPLPGPFDLLLCRNSAFTYLGLARQEDVATRLVAALAPGGYLMIGGGERLPAAAPGMAELARAGRCLYRRSAGG